MNDFELFSRHWQNAVDGLVGRIVNSEKAVFTQKNINDIWREELLYNRFLSYQGEAGDFLRDLRQRDYDTARRVEDMLSDSRLDVGMAPELCAAKAVGAVAFSLSAGGEDSPLLWKLLSGTAGLVLAGTMACDLVAASKDRLIKSAAAAARSQLDAFRPVFEQEQPR